MGNAAPVVRSSSSATNCNTPRGEEVSSRVMERIAEEDQSTPVKNGAITQLVGWGGSSPDEISGFQPVPTSLKGDMEAGEGVKHEDDAIYEHQDENDDNDGESDFMEEPVTKRPKKQRGRPKKPTRPKQQPSLSNEDVHIGHAQEPGLAEELAEKTSRKGRGRPKKKSTTPTAEPAETAEPNGPALSHAAEGRSVTKGKRKRGRPKKAEQTEVEEAREEVKEDDEGDTRVDTKKAKTEDSGKVPDGVATHESGETVDDAEPPKISKKQREPAVTDRNTSEDKTEAKQEGRATTSKPFSKTPNSAVLSSASKPLYRVGLSKKSRIAPLLKIRK